MPGHSISCKIARPPNSDSDQSAQIVIASRSMCSQTFKLFLDERHRFCLESVDACVTP